MNKNYRRGYIAERRCANYFASEGYITARTAGSHSPFDVIAINGERILLIQIKRTKTKYNANKLIEELKKIAVPPCVHKCLWVWKDGSGWETYVVL